MRVSLKAMAIAAGALWGGGVLFVGLVNLAIPSYGLSFLQMLSSVYPGFHASRTMGAVLTGTGYAFVDGAIKGLLFSWHCARLSARLVCFDERLINDYLLLHLLGTSADAYSSRPLGDLLDLTALKTRSGLLPSIAIAFKTAGT